MLVDQNAIAFFVCRKTVILKLEEDQAVLILFVYQIQAIASQSASYFIIK